MASRQEWQAPAEFWYVPPRHEHVQVPCSNGSTCREVLRISVEDAREGTIPQVDGWRTVVAPDGSLYAYCRSCGEEKLPPEEASLYRGLR